MLIRLIDNKFGNKCVVFKDTAFGKFADCRNGEGAYGGTWIENAVQAMFGCALRQASRKRA
jgi:hypothetical protein